MHTITSVWEGVESTYVTERICRGYISLLITDTFLKPSYGTCKSSLSVSLCVLTALHCTWTHLPWSKEEQKDYKQCCEGKKILTWCMIGQKKHKSIFLDLTNSPLLARVNKASAEEVRKHRSDFSSIPVAVPEAHRFFTVMERHLWQPDCISIHRPSITIKKRFIDIELVALANMKLVANESATKMKKYIFCLTEA